MTDALKLQYRPNVSAIWGILLIVGLGLQSGCATAPYRYGNFHTADQERSTAAEFEYGKPHKVLDGIAWTAGILPRILTMNRNVNNHEISEETEAKIATYLDENDLNDVLVSVNQYDPKGQWRRLRETRHIAAPWRYTFGTITLVQYTLLPGRVFGGDYYNPYTNTLYVNSDVPAVVLHEAAYAKDVHSRKLPGTYASINELPLIGAWRHVIGINDVLGYAQLNDDWEVERETYCVVYPQMGIYSTALTGSFVPFWDGMIITVGSAVAGHATGQVAMSRRMKQRELQTLETDAEMADVSEDLVATDNQTEAKTPRVRLTKHEKTESEWD